MLLGKSRPRNFSKAAGFTSILFDSPFARFLMLPSIEKGFDQQLHPSPVIHAGYGPLSLEKGLEQAIPI